MLLSKGHVFIFVSEIKGLPQKHLEYCKKLLKKTGSQKTKVFDWYKMFKDGRESFVNDPRCGKPSTSINDQEIENIRKLVLSHRLLTMKDINEQVNII